MIDMLELLKLKAQYGDVYMLDTPSGPIVCRQPTAGELQQLEDIQSQKKLPNSDKCVLIQRQTLIQGTPTTQQLQILGEQILMDTPADEEEYETVSMDKLNKLKNIHKEVMVYLSANLGIEMSRLRTMPISDVCLLFGLAKRVEQMLYEQQDQHQPTQQIRVTPKV